MSTTDELRLGAGIDFADPNSKLAPLYLRAGHLAAVFLLGAVFVLLSRLPLWHTDIWAHLRFGEVMVQTGSLPIRENFSGDFADQNTLYINYQWLAQAGAYLLYQLGRSLAGPEPDSQLGGGATVLATAHATVVVLRLLVLLFVFRRLTGSLDFGVTGVGLVVALSLVVHLGIVRPQILSELAFAVLLLPLSRPLLSRRALLGIPLLFALWVNCHGAFVVGLLLLGTFLAGRLLTVLANSRIRPGPLFLHGWRFGLRSIIGDQQVQRLAMVLCLSISAVALLNPHGPRLLQHAAALARHPNIAFLEEWKPLPPDSPSGIVFLLSGLLLLPILRWSPLPLTPTQLLLLGGFGWQTLGHARFLVWWCMVFPWVVLPHLQALVARYAPAVGCRTGQADFRKTLLAGMVAVSLFLLSKPADWLVFGRSPVGVRSVTAVTPVAASRYLAEQYRRHPDLGRVVFASETLGDFLLWDLRTDPPVRVSCYTHLHLLTPKHWQDCMAVKFADYRWQQILDQQDCAFLVVERSLYGPLLERVRAAPQYWQILDDQGPVFLAKRRPQVAGTSPPRP